MELHAVASKTVNARESARILIAEDATRCCAAGRRRFEIGAEAAHCVGSEAQKTSAPNSVSSGFDPGEHSPNGL